MACGSALGAELPAFRRIILRLGAAAEEVASLFCGSGKDDEVSPLLQRLDCASFVVGSFASSAIACGWVAFQVSLLWPQGRDRQNISRHTFIVVIVQRRSAQTRWNESSRLVAPTDLLD